MNIDIRYHGRKEKGIKQGKLISAYPDNFDCFYYAVVVSGKNAWGNRSLLQRRQLQH